MANTDFKNFTLQNLTFAYPKLDATYKYNSMARKSEKCPQRAQGASWSIGWEMNAADAAKFEAALVAHYNSCNTGQPFVRVFGAKKLDNGSTLFTAKRAGVNAKGEENKAPEVVDSQKRPLADLAFWGGSKGNLIISAHPTNDPDQSYGVALKIVAIQVTEAIYGGSAGVDSFDIVSDGSSAFDTPPASNPFADIPKTAANDLDMDDIPF